MKTTIKNLLFSAGLIFTNFLHAQTAEVSGASVDFNAMSDTEVLLQAVEQTPVIPADEATNGSTFWSVQHAPGSAEPWPPLPFNSPGLSAWDMGDGIYLLDDGNYHYGRHRKHQATAETLGGSSMMAMSDVDMDPSDSDTNEDDDTNSYAPSFTPAPIDTNGLWLQITNQDGNLAYLNLNNATDYVYAIWSTTNLLTPMTNWNMELELFPTDTNCQPFTIPQSGQPMLFIRAEDWTGVTENGNTTPDWWFYYYYGTTALSDTNLDADGNTLGYDYTNNIVPQVFQFSSIEVTNNYVSSIPAAAQLAVTGSPYYIAISTDDTNYASDATWNNYNGSSIAVNLGLTEGWHDVWVGLRGHGDNPSAAVWWHKHLKLDFTPPSLVITNPIVSTVAVPMIQIQGYSPEQLASISYDISNAVGVMTNQDAGITSRYYDTTLWQLTTNYFECLDIPLTNGLNTITLHATDLAGNVAMLVTNFTLDYSIATNPVVQLTWPTNGMKICQSRFTLRGLVDDPTATVTASIADTNGDVNTIIGEVERSGVLWVDNLPLAEGTNWLTLSVTNAAGLSNTTNIMLVKSDMTLVLTNIDGDLWLPAVSVGGLVSDTTVAIWVNGVQGTNYGDGTWFAANVPVSPSGVASFDINAIPVGGDDPTSNTNSDKPDEVVDLTSSAKWTATSLVPDSDGDWYWFVDDAYYAYGLPASGDYDDSWADNSGNSGWTSTHYTWPPSWDDGTFVSIGDDDGVMTTNTGDTEGEPWTVDHSDITSVDEGDTYNQTGQTTWQLRVGGRSNQEYIMQVGAGITAFNPDWLNTDPDYSVPSTNIVMGDFGSLDSSGYAYKKVSGGEVHDITPNVNNKDYYKLNAVPSKQRYELTHACEVGTPTNKDRLIIGIGEAVDLSGMPGNTIWSTSAGGLSATNGSGITFTAPSNAPPSGTTVTVTTTVGNAAPLTVNFIVMPPNGFVRAIITSTHTNDFAIGLAGALMNLNVYIAPTNVSFYRVEIMEVGEDATNNTGYWAYDASPNYYSTNDLHHSSADAWTSHLNDDNSLPIGDTCGTLPLLPPWGVGGNLTWSIPAKWRVGDNGATNDLQVWSSQNFSMDASGTVSITKFGETITRTTNNVVTPSL